jgi:hypothetical protein
VRYFEKEECGDNLGHWSKRSETWYTERLQAIQTSEQPPQPLSYTEWKSKLHGVKAIRSFQHNANRVSEQLLTEHGRSKGQVRLHAEI